MGHQDDLQHPQSLSVSVRGASRRTLPTRSSSSEECVCMWSVECVLSAYQVKSCGEAVEEGEDQC